MSLSKHKYNNVYLSVVRVYFHYFWTRSGTLHCPKRPYATPTATASTTIVYPLKVLACPKVSPWSHFKTEHPLDIFIRMGTCQSYDNSAHRCWTEVVLNSKFMNTGTCTRLFFSFFFFFSFSAFQRLSWFWTTSFDHMLRHVILWKPSSLCNVSPHSCLHLRCIQDTGADNQRARALEHRALELETKVNVIACIMHRTRAGN